MSKFKNERLDDLIEEKKLFAYHMDKCKKEGDHRGYLIFLAKMRSIQAIITRVRKLNDESSIG